MKLLIENWRNFVNEAEMRIYGTQKDYTPPEDDPDAKDPGAWRAFRDNEYLEIESDSGFFFIHSEQKRLRSGELKFDKKGRRQRASGRSFITHKPSGKQIPERIILLHPDFSGKTKLTFNDLKKYMVKLDKWAVENIPDIASETLSRESEAKLAAFVAGEAGVQAYQTSNTNSMMENWRKFINEAASKETADSFKKLAAAFGNVSSSISDDAEASEEMKEKFDELYSQFEEIGLDKIPDLGELMKNVENGEGLAELTKSLQDAGIKPEEMGEKLEQIQVLRDEFDEYKKEQEEIQKEKDQEQVERDQEQDAAMKDASRAAADSKNAAVAQAEG